jgi:hypothetical protein
MLIRGIKSLSVGYRRDFADVPDTEENLSTCLEFESDDAGCIATTTDSWPDFVLLNASVEPVEISSDAVVERTEGGKFLDRVAIYRAPKIDSQSNVQNPKFCCSKIIVNFENVGKYSLENEVKTFIGKDFDDYRINLSSDVMFEKEFLVCSDLISENADQRGALAHEGALAKCRIYPYGGFCEYGAHPKQMESCVFRTIRDGGSLVLRILPLSSLRSAGIDPTADQRGEPGYRFVGVKDFSNSQKTNLYDELKSGACEIEIANKNTEEKATFKSFAVSHVSKTNLISISFIHDLAPKDV